MRADEGRRRDRRMGRSGIERRAKVQTDEGRRRDRRKGRSGKEKEGKSRRMNADDGMEGWA